MRHTITELKNHPLKPSEWMVQDAGINSYTINYRYTNDAPWNQVKSARGSIRFFTNLGATIIHISRVDNQAIIHLDIRP